MRKVGWVACVLFVATVWAANYAVEHWGFVNVGFGLIAPAGVYFAGVAFTLRDVTQRLLGRLAASGAILVGAGLSYFVSERLALASATAFLLSEFADFGVFALLERASFLGAVVVSNVVGLVVDTLVFLSIADLLGFWKGQMVGKAWMTLAALPVLLLARRWLPAREPQYA